jgi:amphi-Trp domain-containing protein
MSKDNSKVQIEQVVPLSEAIDHLEKVLETLKAGQLTLRQGADVVTLVPGSVVDMEIAASQKKDKEKFSVKMKWKRGYEEQGVTITNKSDVEIS